MPFLQPLSQARRDTSLDVLRGFALAGVLLTFCITDTRSAPNYTNTVLDNIIDWPKWIFIENRMYTMLITLFGIGFCVQLKKAIRSEAAFVPVFLRRAVGLIILGGLHAIFLSTRDVLIFYGVSGAILLLLRNAKSWQLFTVMILIFLSAPLISKYFPEGYKAFSLAQANNYHDHFKHNWEFFLLYHQVYFIYGEMLIYFMLGFMLNRSGIFQRVKNDRKLLLKLLTISLVGTAALIPFCYFYLPTLYPLFGKISSPFVLYVAVLGVRLVWMACMMVSVMLYAVVLIAVYKTVEGKKWLSSLAAFGQMSLSNYLIQSIILVPYLLELDMYDNTPPFTGFILFIITLALQLIFSKWWMARYTLGPFEWLLRSFTYWKWQEIRRTVPLPEHVKTFDYRSLRVAE